MRTDPFPPPAARALHGSGGPRAGRRGLLLGLAATVALGSARLALAQAPGERRLVVVLLRGALDGLAAVPAYGDPHFAALRGPLALPEPGQEGGALDLGGHFGLHPRLRTLHALYRANEALVLHAVAGPHRSRSHFEAQDLLEGGAPQRLSSGWLNRALAAMPAPSARGPGNGVGLAVGTGVPLLLRGPAAVRSYAPQGLAQPEVDLLARIAALHERDPLLGHAVAEGLRNRGFTAAALAGHGTMEGGGAAAGPGRNAFPALAGAAGRLLAAADGPRVAALEIGGWDTHAGQPGRLVQPLGALDDGIAALRDGLGEHWRRTAVLVVTEFGRTVRVNGTLGTDHGTAGAAFVLGGAVAGGEVRATWPGLAEHQLFQGRDLAPTMDLRAVAKGLLRDHLRLPPGALAEAFPGSEAIAPMRGLVRA
ncbi:hypothetical protein GCM10010964_30510 [Caldovatus sediminis]|uniref:DUF1501 domain-containing protein n=1 Tax=Caldovatus sediminis TaxID=2041189 RepID=A0A8J3EBV0_9PROT|nr:DUF1501 domain-containing protein [Caldovatus sediminis]GGG40790.1 hypothetical protein GCM10010964_30510 [Caldovatus sediminis]